MFQLLAEQKKLDDEMRRQLKLQSEIHADHLREALLVKEQETQRMLQRGFTEQADADSIKHKTQLAAMTGRLHALTAALKGKYPIVSLYLASSDLLKGNIFLCTKRENAISFPRNRTIYTSQRNLDCIVNLSSD